MIFIVVAVVTSTNYFFICTVTITLSNDFGFCFRVSTVFKRNEMVICGCKRMKRKLTKERDN